MNQKTIISCMGVVTYINNEQIYVALLKDKDNNWVLPKGHFKDDESFVETAMREVYEETNIKLKMKNLVDKIGEFSYFSDLENSVKNIKVYLFKINEPQKIIPLEKENFVDSKWFSLEEAINKVAYQEQKDVLRKVSKYI